MISEEAILALFDGTRTVKEIVVRSGYSRRTIYNLAKKHGLNHYGIDQRKDRHKTAYDLRQKGLKWNEIAERLEYDSLHCAYKAAKLHAKRIMENKCDD